MRRSTVTLLGVGLLAGALAALAVPPEDQIARLGQDLTPVGAERAGNAEGTIPEWTGGVTEPPPGWEPGMARVDIFADDQMLFSIDASNMDQYADKLTDGQKALIDSYEGYRMNVYPSRRSCAFPEYMYESFERNLREGSVDEQCFLTGGLRAPIFPIPQSGCEAIQNGKLAAYNAIKAFERIEATIVPTRGGSFVPTRRRQTLLFRPNFREYETFEDLDGIWTKSLSNTVAPPKVAGEITLVHALDKGSFRAWTYNPGQRRVRRAPNFEYDNPVPGWQGLVTVDQVNGYVGAADRFDWKLLGKKELFIPYNNTKIHDKSLTYKNIIQPRYPRRDLIRYELHRVWMVEGTVRSDKRHVMPRRIFYMDEDTWIISTSDNYDSRGNLWRVTESLPELIYEVPSCINNTTFFYDLVAGRYVASPLFNEEVESDYLAGHRGDLRDEGFTPDDVRRMGRR